MTNLVDSGKALAVVDSQVLKDFMISLDKVDSKVDNSHLEIYLMNLKSSLEELKVEVKEVKEVARLDKEEKILLYRLK